jgi:hypothetical protein
VERELEGRRHHASPNGDESSVAAEGEFVVAKL